MLRHIPQLEKLARLYGVLTQYEDVHKRRRVASDASLLAVLRALGADVNTAGDVPRAVANRQHQLAAGGVEPVVVAWNGMATPFDLTLPDSEIRGAATCSVHVEDKTVVQRFDIDPAVAGNAPYAGFRTVGLSTPSGLPHGYYEMEVEIPGRVFSSLVISAPRQVYSPTDQQQQRIWGCFLPLYAIRSETNWGAGDFTDLAELSAWIRQQGGRLAGTLPLLAAYLDEPYDPSPYGPVSRLFWNEFYIDVTRIEEFRHCTAARQMVSTSGFQQELARLREADEVSYRQIMAVKRQVMERLAADFFANRPSPRFDQFWRFVESSSVREYAAFRANYELRRQPWWHWPAPMRQGQLPKDDYDQPTAAYHCYVQWIATQQLQQLADEATAAGEGLYLDLPLGVRRDGYDTWRNQQLYLASVSTGAPPDAVFTKGQDWGLAPLHPEQIRRDGYRHVREFLSHHMRFARTMRIDHVMGLHRLYCIGDGMPASDGVYVGYRYDELYAVISLESHIHQTTIIGEDLGTVPKEVTREMDRHGMQRMFIVQYELQSEEDEPLGEVPRECLASLNTHDMPPFAAWWRGEDIPQREQLGLLSPTEATEEKKTRAGWRKRLANWLFQRGWLETMPAGDGDLQAVVVAMLEFLAASPAESVLVNLEDLWLEIRPQNIPGTVGRQNWRRKSAYTLQQIRQLPQVEKCLCDVARRRAESRGKPSPKSQISGSAGTRNIRHEQE